MDQCAYCQGPVDEATGICRRCGRHIPPDTFDQAPPLWFTQTALDGRCPGCGEATIPGQHFCRRCGLALPAAPNQPEDQLIAQPAGAWEAEAETMVGSAPPLQRTSGSAGVWWRSSTTPAITTKTDDRPSRALRRWAWVTLVLIVVVGISGYSGYLVLHAQTQQAPRSASGVSGVSAPGASPTTQATPAPSPSPTPTPPPPVGTGYWHTRGAQILDAANHPVRIAGINWFGFESSTFVVHGLGQRDYHDLLRLVKSLGYNTIRLPYSDQLFFPGSVPNGISFSNGMNQDLQGLNGLQTLDKIVAAAGQLGLRTILDHHGVDAGSQVELWSARDCSVSCFEADWRMLARHYLGNTTVIGADLNNEPHGVACWGCGDPAVDWQMEAEKLGNEILAINPHWLIFVQGVECYRGDCFWWGGNLKGVAHAPVRLNVPNQVVYSPHDYPPDVFSMPYFYASNYPKNLAAIWDAHWGFIAKDGIAPVWLGEFGTTLATKIDRQWLTTLINYLGSGVTGMSWAYWALNPDSTDTGGILQNDWTTVIRDKQDYLNPIEFPLGGS